MEKMVERGPQKERASNKLTYYGPNALSNSELLSLIIRNGSKGKDAVELAEDVLSYTALNLGDLGCAQVAELAEIDGMGPAKAASVVAAMELSKRLAAEKKAQLRARIVDARSIAELLYDQLQNEQREHFILFCLDVKLRLIAQVTIAIGSLDTALVHPREVFGPAIRRGAAAIIVAHNHPSSGDPSPSPQDVELTNRLIEAGNILGIKLMDHVIVGNGCYTSMLAEGYFDQE